MNRAVTVAVTAFCIAVAASGALIAVNVFEHLQALRAADRECVALVPRIKSGRQYEQRLLHCLQKRGVLDKNATLTFTVTHGTPEPVGLSFSTHFYVKRATTKTQSGATAQHT